MSTGCPPNPLACPPPGSMKATGSRERPRNEVPEMPVINRDVLEKGLVYLSPFLHLPRLLILWLSF